MSLPGLTRQFISPISISRWMRGSSPAMTLRRRNAMPMIDADGCLLNVSVEGRDGGPTLMLSNSLGTTMQMWEPQMAALTKVFRVIRYDRRGHGKSGVPASGYSMERYGRDVLAILDDLNIGKVHWCGLSMGGMVGQWLGANAPERFNKIILANTSCYYPDPTNWHNRIKAVREGGIAAVADAVIGGWLTADFREREPQITANMKAMLTACPVDGYLGACEALSTLDQRALLPQIKSPTLVIAGRHDMATPIAAGEFIRSQIPGATAPISATPLQWRAMTAADLPAVKALADIIHTAYPEDETVFADRLMHHPAGCFVLEGADAPVGYIVSHPWQFGQPPRLNTRLDRPALPHSTYYIHDLALLPAARGSGAAAAIVTDLAAGAARARRGGCRRGAAGREARDRGALVAGEFAENIAVAGDEGVFGDDGDGLAKLGADFEAAAGDAKVALGGLVAVGGAAHGDALRLPARGGKLAAEELGRAGFHHDLGLEIEARAPAEIFVVGAGE
eukprot:gene36809-49645_t